MPKSLPSQNKRFKSTKLMWAALVLGMPLLSYLFLDQISVRRAQNYAYRWYALESAGPTEPQQFVSKYEDALLSGGSDIKGMGLVKDGRFVVTLGEPYLDARAIERHPDSAISTRIGFLKYLTSIGVQGSKDMSVYFIFSDDTAVLDFVWLLVMMALTILLTTLMRSQLERQRLQIIQDNTILSMQSFAHDFRGPFSKLRILLKLLQDKRNTDPGELERYEKDLNSAVMQTDDMLTDFLSFGKTEIKKEPIDLSALLRRLEAQEFQERAEELKISFTLDVEPDAVAFGNSQKTIRVLMNLIDNAFKHAKSFVIVHLKSRDRWLEVSVVNDGTPIPKQDLPHLFEPFFSSRKGGVGLGLFIAQTFAREQNGDVKCESDSRATVFRLVLPKHIQSRERKAIQPVESSPSGETHIAYVDDESFYRNLVSNTLSREGIRVDCFNSTDELLTKLKDGTYKPGLILVDRFGPHFDAIENRFAESCRDYGYSGPIVLYSSSVGVESYPEVFKAIEKSTLLSGADINNLIREFQHESQ